MQDSTRLTDVHEHARESVQCDSALDDAGGRCSSSSLVHTQGKPGAEPGPATKPPKEFDRQPARSRHLGFTDQGSIATFAFLNAVYDWADLAGMDVIVVRDEREWCAIVRLRDSVGPFQVEVAPVPPRRKGKAEYYEEYRDKVAAAISRAIQQRREERIRQYAKANPAGVDARQIDIEELIAEAKRRAQEN